MAEIQHQGVMAMVNIDGDKVKQLREQKGLTQLYVATVVQVTTDTISRWENKRYPTIKKENGLRLAEALEVDLNDILKIEDEDGDGELQEDEIPSPEPVAATAGSAQSRSRWPVALALLCLVLLTAAVAYYLLHKRSAVITAKRIMPHQCTAGQPFPIAIEVKGPKEVPLAIIVKEQIPDSMTILASEPPLPSPGDKNRSLKWLKKIEGRTLFTYIVTLSQPPRKDQLLAGSVATGNNGSKPVTVTGSNTIQLTTHHWADTDGDNSISDQEILAVYDQYGDLEKLGIDVDLIEEIWLGSGYSWNGDKKIYEIVP